MRLASPLRLRRRREARAAQRSFIIAGGARAPHNARKAVRSVMASRPDLQEIEDAELLVSELVTNSVRHGGAGPMETIGLTITLLPSGSRIEVADPRGRFERPPIPEDTGGTSGRGLMLVEMLASRWGTRTSPGTVWCEVSGVAQKH